MGNRFIDFIGKVNPYPDVNIIEKVDLMESVEKITLIMDKHLTIKAFPGKLEEYDNVLFCIKDRKKFWEVIITKE